MPNYGLCADCDKEVELTTNGCCSICQSESTMKRGAISELELAIADKDWKANCVVQTLRDMFISPPEQERDRVEKFIKALEDYKNV